MFPKARVKVLLGTRIVQLSALVVLGLWIVLQFLSGVGSIMSPTDQGGVAYMAHIGGFVTGFLLAFLFRKRRGNNA
jgi:membrane associated rhomboid family serine protease